MIKVKSEAILNCSLNKVFEASVIPEISKSIFPFITSIERKVVNIPTYEGENYKIFFQINGKDHEQICYTKEIMHNQLVRTLCEQKNAFINTTSYVEEALDCTKLIIETEIIFKNKFFKILEGLFSRNVVSTLKKNLIYLYKYLDAHYEIRNTTYEAKVWGLDSKLAYFLSFLFVVAFSFFFTLLIKLKT